VAPALNMGLSGRKVDASQRLITVKTWRLGRPERSGVPLVAQSHAPRVKADSYNGRYKP